MKESSKENRNKVPEISWNDVHHIVLHHWKLILGSALILGLVGLFNALSRPLLYSSTAQIVVRPLSTDDRQPEFAEVYRSLLKSDRVLQGMAQRLIDRGMLPPEDRVVERYLSARVEASPDRRYPNSLAVLTLTARGETPEKATAKVNSWAESFIDESRSMLNGSTGGAEDLLTAQLQTARNSLAELEVEKIAFSNQFEKQEAELRDTWDQRISNQITINEKARTEFQSETLRKMQEILEAHLQGITVEAPAERARLREDLDEIVNIYWQLARTSRLLTLEKAPSDETLSDLLAAGRLDDASESRLKTEEANPLYDLFAAEAVRRVLALKRESEDDWSLISPVVTALESLLFTRTADLGEIKREQESKLRSLRRQQAVDLSTLARQRAEKQRMLGLRIEDLNQLEAQLRQEASAALVKNLLDQAEVVGLASPASVARPEARRALLAAASWFFLGGILGFTIALLISLRSGTREQRVAVET